ncbi:MAG TPA: RNA 2',3'-cyclic phosphodiesterase [Candidatus Wirthbacteria bacterium]|nr:RNA 2',3'-cyclic phosphodiesterase [Candidatus Wirthbacteria bacterium]
MLNGCFLAIPLPEDQVSLFVQMCNELKLLKPAVRFQKADSPHLTLLYFGQLREDKYAKILDKMPLVIDGIEPFELEIKGTDFFGSDTYPRVVWLGVNPNDELGKLQIAIREHVGAYSAKKDERPFHAHLTIARIESAKKFLQIKKEFTQIANNFQFKFTADRIRVYLADTVAGIRQIPAADFLMQN